MNITENLTTENYLIKSYGRLGLDIKLLEDTGTTKTVEISQNRSINGYILNREQLVERAKDVLER